MRSKPKLWRILRIQLKEIQRIIKIYYKHVIFFIIIATIIFAYYVTQQKRSENIKYKKWYKSWQQIKQEADNKTN
jgi:hypothetical protein